MGIRARTAWLAGAGAIALTFGSAGVYQLTSGDQAASTPTATTRVQRGTVTATVAAAGTLQPAQTRGLAFSMDGTVTEVRVRPGDQVAAGDVLARIDNTDAKERVSSAKDALASAKEALGQARESSQQTSSGGSGSSAGSGCLAAVAYLTSPGVSPTPVGLTTPSPVPSPTPSSGSTHPAGQPSASAGTGKDDGKDDGSTGGGGRSCADKGNDSGGGSAAGGSDRILSAQQRVNDAQLQLENAEKDLAGTTITAPIAGKVLSVAGAVGSRATASSSGFIVLGDVADMQVKVDFPEADASALTVGQTATVTLADRPDESLPAKVTQVDSVGTVDGQMVRFGALLAFDTVPDDVLSGQSANVRVETDSVSDVLYVSATAVHDSGDGSGTVMVQSGKVTAQRTVEVGLRGDQNVEIRSGLTEGEEVLSSW